MHSSVYLWTDLPALLIEETKEILGTKRSQPFRSHYPPPVHMLNICKMNTSVCWLRHLAGYAIRAYTNNDLLLPLDLFLLLLSSDSL